MSGYPGPAPEPPEKPERKVKANTPRPRRVDETILSVIEGGSIVQSSWRQEGNGTIVTSTTGREFKLLGANVCTSLDGRPGDGPPKDSYGSFPVEVEGERVYIIHQETRGGGRPESVGADGRGRWYRLLGTGKAERIVGMSGGRRE
jgi:hypothetical protein